MRNILLTFFATCTVFLAVSVYMQAEGRMVITPTHITQADQDQLTAMINSYDIINGEKR